jgi:stringent starvation protein B
MSHHIRVPVEFVLGIYSRETGQGMVFSEEASAVPGAPGNAGDAGAPDPVPPPDKPRRPSLKVVK